MKAIIKEFNLNGTSLEKEDASSYHKNLLHFAAQPFSKQPYKEIDEMGNIEKYTVIIQKDLFIVNAAPQDAKQFSYIRRFFDCSVERCCLFAVIFILSFSTNFLAIEIPDKYIPMIRDVLFSDFIKLATEYPEYFDLIFEIRRLHEKQEITLIPYVEHEKIKQLDKLRRYYDLYMVDNSGLIEISQFFINQNNQLKQSCYLELGFLFEDDLELYEAELSKKFPGIKFE